MRWAIQNGLIQQGATLLEEAVTTFILFDIGQQEVVNDESKRSKAIAALTVGENTIFDYTTIPDVKPGEAEQEIQKRERAANNRVWEEKYVPVIRNLQYKKKLAACVNSIKKSVRDDVNHAGFRESPRSYEELRDSLQKRYQEIRKIFINANKLELPELKIDAP